MTMDDRRTTTPIPTTLAVLAAALMLALLAAPPPADARVTIGIGQQTPEIFRSPHWHALNAPDVRYIAPWDTATDPLQLDKLDTWMAAADGAGARVMLGFQRSLRSERSANRLPTRAEYRRAFKALQKRYPQVRTWVPWNEANNAGSLTGKAPKRAAAYYNIVRKACPRCQIVAGDVLDQRNLESWLKRYQRHLKTRPAIWGLHNYHDANARISKSTDLMLRLTKGQLWFTETGGVVRMRVAGKNGMVTKNYGIRHAAKSTRYVLNLARKSNRIKRIYLYHWLAPSKFTTWDSAMTNHKMQPRMIYRTVYKWLNGARKTRLAT
jgi:hypothetical protein